MLCSKRQIDRGEKGKGEGKERGGGGLREYARTFGHSSRITFLIHFLYAEM